MLEKSWALGHGHKKREPDNHCPSVFSCVCVHTLSFFLTYNTLSTLTNGLLMGVNLLALNIKLTWSVKANCSTQSVGAFCHRFQECISLKWQQAQDFC